VNPTTKRRICLLAVAVAPIALLGLASYPLFWRRSAYHTVRHLIEQGDEDKAIREVERLSKKSLFKPDWTTTAVMPRWRWVHDLDNWLFGCPACRGNWETLLQHAAQHGQARLVATLIRSGASVDSEADHGCHTLQLAVAGGDTNVIAILIANGADVNATNSFGSVLHIAAAFCPKPEVLRFLLAAGAKPNGTDFQGRTALDCATIWNPEAVPLLVAHGAVASTNRRIALPNGKSPQTTGQN
jgi:hypothetical protein